MQQPMFIDRNAISTCKLILIAALVLAMAAIMSSCAMGSGSSATAPADDEVHAAKSQDPSASTPSEESVSVSASASSESSSLASTSSSASSAPAVAESPLCYPLGWLAVDVGDAPAGTQLKVLSLPDMGIAAHRDGAAVSAKEQRRLQGGWPSAGETDAVVEYDGEIAVVPADLLLVNLPDVLDGACFDVVYSYSTTSRCAGQVIPEVTGERLPGYPDGKQTNLYLAQDQFKVPCAYRTALKAQYACDLLADRGYRLLVYDAYRPMSAQLFLSEMFEAAFWENADMQASLGDWALEWYVASGVSGHNYGTDLDVGACDMDGNPVPMPSLFDAFDETGHLTSIPLDSASITPAAYREAVAQNDACMALHEAFTSAGFTELASEWWHFGDEETEGAMRSAVGDAGLDFSV